MNIKASAKDGWREKFVEFLPYMAMIIAMYYSSNRFDDRIDNLLVKIDKITDLYIEQIKINENNNTLLKSHSETINDMVIQDKQQDKDISEIKFLLNMRTRSGNKNIASIDIDRRRIELEVAYINDTRRRIGILKEKQSENDKDLLTIK